MFDFEKLDVYAKAKAFNKGIYAFLAQQKKLDNTTRGQLRRASFSIMLNIAEGCGRFSKADRRNFFIISRGSVFECVSILDFLKDEKFIAPEAQEQFYRQAEELSKILYAMIRNLEK
jgi:four helix bundle protein